MPELGVRKLLKKIRKQYELEKLNFVYRIHTTYNKGRGGDVLKAIEGEIRNKQIMVSVVVENNAAGVVKVYTFYCDEDVEDAPILDS